MLRCHQASIKKKDLRLKVALVSLSLMTILLLHCSTQQQAVPHHLHWHSSQTNTTVCCETHCIVVTVWVAFGFSEHLKKLPFGTICQPPATLFLLFWQVVLLLPGTLAPLDGCAGC